MDCAVAVSNAVIVGSIVGSTVAAIVVGKGVVVGVTGFVSAVFVGKGVGDGVTDSPPNRSLAIFWNAVSLCDPCPSSTLATTRPAGDRNVIISTASNTG